MPSSSSSSSPPPLVWVTQGKSQHAAHLLESTETKCLVRWSSTNTKDWVECASVVSELTPRRRRQQQQQCATTPMEECESEILMKSNRKRKNRNDQIPSNDDNSDDDDDDDDNEVQVLLTILPPPPTLKRPSKAADESRVTTARRVSRSPQEQRQRIGTTVVTEKKTMPCTNECTTVSQDQKEAAMVMVAAVEVSVSKDHDNKKVPFTSSTPAALTDSAVVTQRNDSVTTQYHAFQSSAYVQNLAEICFTILNDRRWRTSNHDDDDDDGCQQGKRLFAWERGEDLSAVCLLSKLFLPLPPKQKRRLCKCLQCPDKKQSPSCNVATTNYQVAADEAPPQANDGVFQETSSNVDDEIARAIHFYCRLCYRKGPWFRLDDLYKRYYAPKRRETQENTSGDVNGAPAPAEDGDDDVALHESRRSFCLPSSLQPGSKRHSEVNIKADTVIDPTVLQEHILAVATMMGDIDHLVSIGLIRSFDDEEECGKTAGAVTPDGHGLLLRTEERRALLQLLGGANKKKKHTSSTSNNSYHTSGSNASTNDKENVIWRQMRRQRSLSLEVPKEGNGSKVLLPVRRHVNDLVFDKLTTAVVLASSNVEYVPAAVMRAAVADAKKRVLKLLKCSSKTLSMCVRMREAPLLTLRRCARLYLCATSGPGDMRGDGTNAWRSLKEVDIASVHPDVPIPTVIQPPGSYSWHRVVHPPLAHRFGIASCAFIDAHEFLDCSKGSQAPFEQVFQDINAFHLWEECVELRAHVDYHLELNDMILYQARRHSRLSSARDGNKSNSSNASASDGGVEEEETAPSHLSTAESLIAVDFLHLLTVDGRKALAQKLVALVACSEHHVLLATRVHQDVEHTISEIDSFIREESKRSGKTSADSLFETHSQRIVVVISAIIMHVLIIGNQAVDADEVTSKPSRPWLRHLCWEGILAYSLWDCIPLLERKGFYEHAISCLHVILFGKLQALSCVETHTFGATASSERFVSRRTRGKAFERLVIDTTHLLRQKEKVSSGPPVHVEGSTGEATTKDKTQNDGSSTSNEASPQAIVSRLCTRVIGAVALTGSIPFSAVRFLARKLKTPLADTLRSVDCAEVLALGLRLENSNGSTAAVVNSRKQQGYVDWVPPTDHAVANAMAPEETPIVGKRCSYVGFEENAGTDTSSLNVEQLATEFYASGRLPLHGDNTVDALSGGGWTGWHDEGGHVRALFRIICARPILGMASGCGKECESSLETLESRTIHLTPYQGAPFDLHVAHWEVPFTRDDARRDDIAGVRSFYRRRQKRIDAFLNKLERLRSQELCDLVYDSIFCTLEDVNDGRVKNSSLVRDLQQIRTLSMVAAGFGGKQLAAMFRCLLYDYRHYSGGLPDLLLARALYSNTVESDPSTDGKASIPSLVDLGTWVGEEFTAESKMEHEAATRANVLIDKDDEFLGCSKIGDSGAQSAGRWRKGGGVQRQPSRDIATTDPSKNELPANKLPDRLVLRHNDRNVEIQCMFVEVKSLNDRLDGRQEDWLNVLDRVGNARVCKFDKGKKPSKKTNAGEES